MKESIKLKLHNYPKMIQNFAEENFNLKALLSLTLGLLFLSFVLVIYLVKKGPLVIAMNSTGAVVQVETKVTDLQVEMALKEYIKHRYSWDEKSIAREVKSAQHFVRADLASSFEKSMAETIKYVREKKVSQRVYVKTITLNYKERKALVHLDRITEFENLKAATEMRLELFFEVSDRTLINPWGVYVTKELEGVQK